MTSRFTVKALPHEELREVMMKYNRAQRAKSREQKAESEKQKAKSRSRRQKQRAIGRRQNPPVNIHNR